MAQAFKCDVSKQLIEGKANSAGNYPIREDLTLRFMILVKRDDRGHTSQGDMSREFIDKVCNALGTKFPLYVAPEPEPEPEPGKPAELPPGPGKPPKPDDRGPEPK